ncbi:MAG: hypothetical protein FWD76_03840, partial [Firmicutes bacterium]|nr:hypothetical protein [Bacillota bacterium]
QTGAKPKKHRRLKKKGSIVKISILGFLTLVGILMSVLSFHLPFNNGVQKYNSFATSVQMSLDLKGGFYAVYEADDKEVDGLSLAMDKTRDSLENLVVSAYSESTVVRQGVSRIRVQAPEAEGVQSMLETVGKPTTVSFKINDKEEMNGSHIESATPVKNYGGVAIAVVIKFNDLGKKEFDRVTGDNIGQTLVLEVTPKGQTVNTTNISLNQHITDGTAVISGGLQSFEQATTFAAQLAAGSFAAPLKTIEIAPLAPTLGQNTQLFVAIAAGVLLAAVIAYLCVRYKFMGLMAAFAFVMFSVLLLFGLAVVPWVRLSIAGVAGVLVGVALAVDAAFVIIQKVKEEYKAGKSLNASLAAGFHRGFMAMLDTHIVSLVASIVILGFVPGVFKGFGLVLLIATLVSMFSMVFVFGKLLRYMAAILGDKKADKMGLKRGEGIVVDEESGVIMHTDVERVNPVEMATNKA